MKFLKSMVFWSTYAITLIIGILLVVLWVLLAEQADLMTWLNSTFASAIVMLCIGWLIFVSSKGQFDPFSYYAKKFTKTFSKNKMTETYYDYRNRERGFSKEFYLGYFLSSFSILIVSIILLLHWTIIYR